MLKKLIAMTIVTTMILSSFCIIAQAEYGYSYGEEIVKKTAGNSNDNAVNQKAGDSVTNKTQTFASSEKGRGLYFLYNYDAQTDTYKRDDASATSMRGTNCFAMDSYYPRLMADFKTRAYRFYTSSHAGKYFFSQKKGVPTFQIKPNSGVNFNNTSTMSYMFDIKYNESTDIPQTVFKLLLSGVGYNVLGIDTDGYITSGQLSYNTAKIGKIEKGKEYTFVIVMETYENSETAGTYDIYKKIYVKDNSNENAKFENIYCTLVKTAETLSHYKFQEFDVEFYPYTYEQLNNADFYKKLTTDKGDEYNYYVGGYNTSDTSLQPSSAIDWKYQLKNVDFYVDDIIVAAGNVCSEKVTSVTDSENINFFVSSTVNTANIPTNQMITVAAQATTNTTLTGGKLVLATYDKFGELQGVKIKDLSIVKDSISETVEKIERVNQIDSKLNVMLLKDMTTLIPLGTLTSFVQPEIYVAK